MHEKTRRLSHLLDTLKNIETARLAQTMQQKACLHDKLEALKEQERAGITTLSEQGHFSAIERMRRATSLHIGRAKTELAECEHDAETQAKALARAVGRSDALRKLLETGFGTTRRAREEE